MSKSRRRARDSKGKFIGDDPTTPGINEAYEYTKWELFKYDFFMIEPEKSLFRETLNFIKWVFTGK